MGGKQVDILGLGIDILTWDQAVKRCTELIETAESHQVITANPELLYRAQKNPELARVIAGADLVTPDGVGVVWASRLYGQRLPERVTGFDLMMELLRRAPQSGWKIYFLGARPDVIKLAESRAKEKFPGIRIIGARHGYFAREQDQEVVADIAAKQPDLLFVGFGAEDQELWIARNLAKLDARVSMGVGGSFDVLAGKVARAPKALQKIGLEWLYRVVREPRRATKLYIIPGFITLVVSDIIRQRIKPERKGTRHD